MNFCCFVHLVYCELSRAAISYHQTLANISLRLLTLMSELDLPCTQARRIFLGVVSFEANQNRILLAGEMM